MPTYNIYFEVASAIYLIVLIVYMKLQYNTNTTINKIFQKLLFITLAADVLDVVSAIAISNGDRIPLLFNTLLSSAYFVTDAMMAIYFLYYFHVCIFGENYEKTIFTKINNIIVIVYLLLFTFNTVGGFIFYFNKDGVYVHGPLYLMVYIVPLYFVTSLLIFILKNRAKFTKQQIISLTLYSVFGIIGPMIQLFFPNVLLCLFTFSLGIIMIFFTMESKDYHSLNDTLSALEKAKKEAEDAKLEAIKANKAKSEFLANMSHEIRTPINAVIGLNQMILRESKEPDTREYAIKVSNASDTLLSVINDVLDISKIESGKMTITPAEYRLADMLDTLVNMVELRAENNGLNFKLTLNKNLPSVLYGDDVKLRQVITNLLTNAVKYTPRGTVELVVDGEIAHDNLMLSVSVNDTGIGIKPEDMSKLFCDYQRLEQKLNRGVEGTGLGLSITSHLLRLMGSTLEVTSTYRKGSSFSFVVSQEIVDSSPIGDLTKNKNLSAEDYHYKKSFVAPNARILAVDDTSLNLYVFRSLLKETKIQIDTANSGMECLEFVESTKYDIIFMDHMMPTMDGIETLHRLKNMPDNLSIDAPVIALTANAIAGMKEMYLSEGFDNFLSKPIEYSQLERMICQYLPEDKFETVMVEVSNEDESRNSFDSLPEIDGINWNYAKTYNPDIDLLFENLKSLSLTIGNEIDKIKAAFNKIKQSPDDDSLNDYRICAHTIKSSTLMIGATQVSGFAKTLEFAARDKDIETILNITPTAVRLLHELSDNLKVFNSDSNTNKSEFDIKELSSILVKLKLAGDELDMDKIDELIEILDTYSFNKVQSECFNNLKAAAIDLDSEKINSFSDKLVSLCQ